MSAMLDCLKRPFNYFRQHDETLEVTRRENPQEVIDGGQDLTTMKDRDVVVLDVQDHALSEHRVSVLDQTDTPAAEIAEKVKKKKKKKDDDESDDEMEASSSKMDRATKIRIGVILSTSCALTLTAMYFEANPVITVGTASLFATGMKTVLRHISQKTRYLGLATLCAGGFVADYFCPYKFNFGPVATSILISAVGRTEKLYILGKLDKDK